MASHELPMSRSGSRPRLLRNAAPARAAGRRSRPPAAAPPLAGHRSDELRRCPRRARRRSPATLAAIDLADLRGDDPVIHEGVRALARTTGARALADVARAPEMDDILRYRCGRALRHPRGADAPPAARLPSETARSGVVGRVPSSQRARAHRRAEGRRRSRARFRPVHEPPRDRCAGAGHARVVRGSRPTTSLRSWRGAPPRTLRSTARQRTRRRRARSGDKAEMRSGVPAFRRL